MTERGECYNEVKDDCLYLHFINRDFLIYSESKHRPILTERQ